VLVALCVFGTNGSATVKNVGSTDVPTVVMRVTGKLNENFAILKTVTNSKPYFIFYYKRSTKKPDQLNTH
jgi:hypothetical protein